MSYQKITSTMAEEDGLTLAEVLKGLLEDELAKERARREELREERRRRNNETWRQEEVMRQQMDLLRGLIEGVQRQGETVALKLERDRDTGCYRSLCSAP